jgi:hypothetical protein
MQGFFTSYSDMLSVRMIHLNDFQFIHQAVIFNPLQGCRLQLVCLQFVEVVAIEQEIRFSTFGI